MNYLKTLKDLFVFLKNTRLPETQMKELQNRKLRTLLYFAWEHSAFYRRTFEKAGITEEKLDSLPLSSFPTIDKQILMEHFDELITVPDLHQEDLRKFDAETGGTASLIWENIMWYILLLVQESPDTSFMMTQLGTPCCWGLSEVLCGI